MSLLVDLTEATDSNYDEVPQEDDESNNSSAKQREKRASLAALDLPINVIGNISTIEKSQTLPTRSSTDITIKINMCKVKNELKEEAEEEEKNLNDIPQRLNRAHSLDTGLMARQPSIEILTTEDDAGNQTKEEVVVPPHDVLVKMPFYTTPLTLEATNNAFRDFSVRLFEMGFNAQSEAALVCTNAESVEAAVDFIENNMEALYHRFIPNIAENGLNSAGETRLTPEAESAALKGIIITDGMLCGGCTLPYSEHLIDHHGERIVSKSKHGIHIDLDDEPLMYGDLGGRVSMSIATRNVREQQKTLQEIIEQRMHAIAEGTVDDIIAKHISLVGEPDQKSAGSALQLVETLPLDYDGPTQKCMVCFDDKPMEEFFDAPCKHNYCSYCLTQHYRIKTQDGDVLKVACIDPGCDREITEKEILNFLKNEPEMIEKFLKFKKQKLIMLNPNARFCYKPNCKGYMIGSRWNPKLICPDCAASVCYNCGQPWHGYFVGCNQHVDIGYARWALNKDVQRCPKCRVRIEKAEGCNHMTCQSCKYQFCWICRGQYSGSHFEWYNIFGCPGAQYTPRFCRCPACFPRWLNRLLIIICFLAIVVPIIIVAGIFWLLIICVVFCIRCEFKVDVCDCF